jgi:cation:H+ antiporter
MLFIATFSLFGKMPLLVLCTRMRSLIPCMALGNIVGSNIFNITLILGLSSQVMPLTSAGITIIDYIVMIGTAILPMLFAFKGRVGRAGGALMTAFFIAYNWYLITNQIG